MKMQVVSHIFFPKLLQTFFCREKGRLQDEHCKMGKTACKLDFGFFKFPKLPKPLENKGLFKNPVIKIKQGCKTKTEFCNLALWL